MASGLSDGLGFENNTRASQFLECLVPITVDTPTQTVLITRSLNEMTCIGVAYGASPLTFLGLGGVGDLFLTCSSPNSRNYTVGFRAGRGESLDHILATLGSVAEGVSTAKGVKKIADELGVFAPITDKVRPRTAAGRHPR